MNPNLSSFCRCRRRRGQAQRRSCPTQHYLPMAPPDAVKHVALSQSSQYHLNRLYHPAIHTDTVRPQPANPTTNAGPVSTPSASLSTMPKEIKDMIFAFAGHPIPRRVWLPIKPLPHPSATALQPMYSAQAPLPLLYLINRRIKQEAQTGHGYIEIKRSQHDPRTTVLSLKHDMVFVEYTNYSVSHVADELRGFRNALVAAGGEQVLGELKSIAVGYGSIESAQGESGQEQQLANWQLLRDFSGLELVFVVFGKRPTAHLKKHESGAEHFVLVRRPERSPPERKFRKDLEGFLARDSGAGRVAPRVVVVE